MGSRGKMLVSLAKAATNKSSNNSSAPSNTDEELATALHSPLIFLEECMESSELNVTDINLVTADSVTLISAEDDIMVPETNNTYVFNLTNNNDNVITLSVANNDNNENKQLYECGINQEVECQGAPFNVENIVDYPNNADFSESQNNIITHNNLDENGFREEINSDIDDPDYIADSSEGNSSSGESAHENNSVRGDEVSENIIDHCVTENTSEDKESAKTRKRKRNNDTYKKIRSKTLRNLGKEYENVNGKVVAARKMTDTDCSKCKLKCYAKFTQEERQIIHSNYWSLGSYTRQRDFICQTVDYVAVKRRRTVTANKKERNGTYIYHFNNPNNGSKEKVCKKFFLRTLDIGERTVFVAKKKQVDGLSPFVSDDKRGRHPPHHKLSEIDRQRIKTHIESFPRLESHYCRKRTKRQYLSSDLSISKMFDLFKETCNDENIQCNIKFGTYSKIFNTEYNLSFHHPKKDACRVCENHKNLTEDEKKVNDKVLEEHLKNKNLARAEKEKDKLSAKEDKTHRAFTFDLQAVLYSPCSNVSSFYYTHKFCTYNLTVNDQAENKGICFVWNETDGKRGSDEIGTAIFKLLHSLPLTVKKVTLTSDSCGGQNRNRFIAALLLYVVNTMHFDEINLKFLETGHTQMEVDSIHSLIERAKKGTTVYSPLEWPIIIRCASRKYPLTVEQLDYKDFIDLKNLKIHLVPTGNLNKDTEGSAVQWMKIKWLRFEKNHIYFKTNYDEENFKEINLKNSRCKNIDNSIIVLKKKFSEPLPIDEKKMKSLMTLCSRGDIPSVYHDFYKSLKTHKNCSGTFMSADCVSKADEEEIIDS